MIAHRIDLFIDHDITIASAEPKLIPVLIVSCLYDIVDPYFFSILSSILHAFLHHSEQ